MSKDKTATHEVIKRGLYFSPKDGELKVGTPMVLNKKQATKLEARGFVKPLKDVDTVDVSEVDSSEDGAGDKKPAPKKKPAAKKAATKPAAKKAAAPATPPAAPPAADVLT